MIMKRLLISGEGVTDCGVQEFGTQDWLEGPVQAYIRDILVDEDIEIISISKRDVFKSRRSKKQKKASSKLSGHADKAFKLCLKAESLNIDHVLCYVDSDFDRSVKTKELSIRRSFENNYTEIQAGYSAYSDDRDKNSIPVVPATMIESWLLGDPDSFLSLFGSYPSNPTLPSKPEYLWGQDNKPDSDYPKNVLRRVLDQSDQEPNRELFNEIASSSSIEHLRENCPLSFDRFYKDLTRIIKI